jgi:dolichyl-phosphate-mannose--protein O-mannosyl transferase
MAVLEPYDGDYYLWHYLPSVPAAIIFLLMFLGCTVGLIWRSWKAHVKWCIPFIVGTFCKSDQKEICRVMPKLC